MSLKKVTTEITYKVPAWSHCNLQGNIYGQPSKDKCRFCIKEKGHYRCALYNVVLDTSQGTLVNKTRACERATVGYNSIVEDVEEQPVMPQVSPKTLIKTTISEYNKIRKQLISQGYPEAIAEKVASEHLLGGK
jgi:hypothetical protein